MFIIRIFCSHQNDQQMIKYHLKPLHSVQALPYALLHLRWQEGVDKIFEVLEVFEVHSEGQAVDEIFKILPEWSLISALAYLVQFSALPVEILTYSSNACSVHHCLEKTKDKSFLFPLCSYIAEVFISWRWIKVDKIWRRHMIEAWTLGPYDNSSFTIGIFRPKRNSTIRYFNPFSMSWNLDWSKPSVFVRYLHFFMIFKFHQ